MRLQMIVLSVLSLILGFIMPLLAQTSNNEIHACVKNNGKIRIIQQGEVCSRRETLLVWNIQGPPGVAGQMNGVRDFTSNGIFIVPDGITRLLIEAWGGGGGGGGGAVNAPNTDPAGGGGGGGGYVHGLVDVIPGQTYNVTIGAPGEGGAAFVAGTGGGTTSFETTTGTTLIFAQGGSGGTAGTLTDDGSGGAGGQGSANGGILISGLNGGDARAGAGFPGGGTGGSSVIGNRIPPASAGGEGGDGGGGAGGDGGPGYLIIQW